MHRGPGARTGAGRRSRAERACPEGGGRRNRTHIFGEKGLLLLRVLGLLGLLHLQALDEGRRLGAAGEEETVRDGGSHPNTSRQGDGQAAGLGTSRALTLGPPSPWGGDRALTLGR